MSDYPMLISNKLHSFRNFMTQNYWFFFNYASFLPMLTYIIHKDVIA
jgi:hypothetical protein